jgi:cystine transport system permease protein
MTDFLDLLKLLAESFPKIVLPGLAITLPLTAIAFTFALVIAVVVALVQYAKIPVLRHICRFYIWVMRGTPLLIQLYLVFFGLPSIGILIDPIPAAILVFSLNEGAYCAETIRGALESVPQGQIEAGRCVGMSFPSIMWHVVLPQAFKTAFPALSNSVISMVKDMSLASNITVAEMFYATQRIISVRYEALALYIELALIYLLFCTVLTWIQRQVEKKIDVNRRKPKVYGRLLEFGPGGEP